MAEIIFRLPGREQYSYAEVKFDEEELNGPGGWEVAHELLKSSLAVLDDTYPDAGSRPQPAQQAPQQSSGGKNCVHGAMALKSSGADAPRQWSAWFCPEKNRAAQCKPIDAKTGKEWGQK